MVKKRTLSDDEKELWQQVVAGTKPLSKKAAALIKPDTPKATAINTPLAKAAPAPKMQAMPQKMTLPLMKKIRKGDVAIDRKIDLHGKTEASAHQMITRAVKAGRADGARLLLIVTGKGRDGQGVLRQNLPRWLAAPALSPYILYIEQASAVHGGAGAYYVYLRKT